MPPRSPRGAGEAPTGTAALAGDGASAGSIGTALPPAGDTENHLLLHRESGS